MNRMETGGQRYRFTRYTDNRDIRSQVSAGERVMASLARGEDLIDAASPDGKS